MTNALLLVCACAHTPNATTPDPPALPSTRGYGAEVRDAVIRVRAATARFFNLDSAVAAGYSREAGTCYADPGHGAMGFHHLNRALLNGPIEVERPQILLYEGHPDGRYTLTGVEYIVLYSRWSRDSVPPTVLGQSLERADELGVWYLHFWVWRENPEGLFADWNPAVKCPAS